MTCLRCLENISLIYLFSIIGMEEVSKLQFEEITKTVFDSNQFFLNSDDELFLELKLKVKKLYDLKLLPAAAKS